MDLVTIYPLPSQVYVRICSTSNLGSVYAGKLGSAENPVLGAERVIERCLQACRQDPRAGFKASLFITGKNIEAITEKVLYGPLVDEEFSLLVNAGHSLHLLTKPYPMSRAIRTGRPQSY